MLLREIWGTNTCATIQDFNLAHVLFCCENRVRLFSTESTDSNRSPMIACKSSQPFRSHKESFSDTLELPL